MAFDWQSQGDQGGGSGAAPVSSSATASVVFPTPLVVDASSSGGIGRVIQLTNDNPMLYAAGAAVLLLLVLMLTKK